MKNLSAFWAAAAGVAVGIVLFAVLGAGTIEDSGIFQSLKLGGKTNLISDDGAALTYNGTHYQISSATLTNASTNAFTGAGLIVLQSAVSANQTNVAAANPTATVSTSAVNGTAGTFMRSDASPAIPAAFIQANQTNETTASITNKLGGFSGATGSYLGADGLFHTVTSGQTNDGTANWSASGTTNSTLPGILQAYGVQLTNTLGVGAAPPANKRLLIAGSSSVGAGDVALELQDTGAFANARNWLIGTACGVNYGDLSFLVSSIKGADPVTSGIETVTFPFGGGINSSDIRFTGTTTVGLRLKSLTTTQKNALTPAAGDMVYDSDLSRAQIYDGAAWHSRVRLDGDTMTGVLTAPGYDSTAPATLTPVDAGVSIDFGAANRLASITLTGAVTFAFANQTAGRVYELFIMGCSTNSPITWPTVSGIYPAGVYPSVAAAGKWHHLKFKCITSSVTTNIYIDGSTSN